MGKKLIGCTLKCRTRSRMRMHCTLLNPKSTPICRQSERATGQPLVLRIGLSFNRQIQLDPLLECPPSPHWPLLPTYTPRRNHTLRGHSDSCIKQRTITQVPASLARHFQLTLSSHVLECEGQSVEQRSCASGERLRGCCNSCLVRNEALQEEGLSLSREGRPHKLLWFSRRSFEHIFFV